MAANLTSDRTPPVPEPIRIKGPTPAGGAYAIIYPHEDGGCEIVEFDDHDRDIMRTYGAPKRAGKP